MNAYLYVIDTVIRSIEAARKDLAAFRATNEDTNKHDIRCFNLSPGWQGVREERLPSPS